MEKDVVCHADSRGHTEYRVKEIWGVLSQAVSNHKPKVTKSQIYTEFSLVWSSRESLQLLQMEDSNG